MTVRLSFRAKLVAIVGTAAAALLILVAAGTAISSRTERALAAIQDRHLPRLQLGPALRAEFERLKRGLQDAVAARDLEAVSATRGVLETFDRTLDAAGAVVPAGEAAALHAAMDGYYQAATDVSRRLVAGETGERLVDAMGDMQEKQARAAALLQTVTAFNPAELTAAFAAAQRAEINGGHVRLVVSLACLLGLVLLSGWIGRGVIRSLAEVTAGLRRFGGGNFEQPVAIGGNDDELADLGRQANQMAESLKRLGAARDQNDWVREARSGLGQQIQGELEPAVLATQAVRFLARHFEAPAAALYYLDARGELGLLGEYGGAGRPGGEPAGPADELGAPPRVRL
ncbi:MAG TPA: HAMP domain-containing protein, partial [Polyangia bacterium]|nr:HAMP domain-containing protein [Polyangia bacterium]